MFVHLNTHSIYSKMRGLLSLTDLMNTTKSYGMDTLALTDVNGLFGFIRFVQHCHDVGIKAIAGVNLMTSTDEIIILVENQYGYENLCQIISSVHDNPGQDISDILKKRLSGLFMLAYNRSTLKKLHFLIPDTHLFVELRPGISETKSNMPLFRINSQYISFISDSHSRRTLIPQSNLAQERTYLNGRDSVRGSHKGASTSKFR